MSEKKKKRYKPNQSKSKVNPFYTISYTNIRGLSGNKSDVATHLQQVRPDFMSICETYDLSGVNVEEDYKFDGYNEPIKKDDTMGRFTHGLLVYVKSGFPCSRDTTFEDPLLPYMCFRIALLHNTAFIFTLYRPHHDGVVIFDSIAEKIDSILSVHPSASIHLCGDFNVHHQEWLVHSNKTDREGRYCHDFALAYDLTQIVDEPTHIPDQVGYFPSLLDLFLTSCPNACSQSVHSPLGSSDHCVVQVKVEAKCKGTPDAPFHRTVFRYSKADWDGFRSFISGIPISDIFKHGSSKIASLLSDWILVGMESYIPSKTFQLKPNSQPWFSPECAAAIAHRNHFFHLYHQNRSDETKAAFKTARNQCKRILRNAEQSYAESIQTRIGEESLGSKEFWRITNKVLGRGKASIPTLVEGPTQVISSTDKASIFASKFASHSTLDDQGCLPPDFPPLTDERLCDLKVSAGQISKLIKELDSTKATGPDSIPVVVLKHLSPELSPIFAKLFNRCLKEKCFPTSWKTSAVCPVFKNAGDKSAPSQYRPISLLSIISKLFESVINKGVLDHLVKNNLLTDVQYGFRSSRSTADVLTVITHRISEAIAKGNHTRVVALDISKAFDKVWHKGLLHKLSSYGIGGNLYAVIKSFLSGRSLKVVINGQSSEAHAINAGVPQGSILGPTLFLLFINDLPNHIIESLVDIYADDSTLYKSTSSDVDDPTVASDISSDLEQVVQWGKRWFVSFNAPKTKLGSFHHKRNSPSFSSIQMDGSTLKEAPCLERLLGLKLTLDLRWNSYILSVAKETSKMVGSFFRSKRFLTPAAILYLYKSQIRPRMEYCCHIWAGASQHALSCLDRVQSRLRYLVGDSLFSSLQPLSHRRNVASLSLLYRYYNGKCSNELHEMVPPRRTFVRNTRFSSNAHPHFLEIETSHQNFHMQSFFPRTATLWNSLPADCFPESYNLVSFKKRVNRCLLSV